MSNKMKTCDTCGWSDWTIRRTPCKECQEVGAFHKWKERKQPLTPRFEQLDSNGRIKPDIEKYQKPLPFGGDNEHQSTSK